jgi:hypothetical protein
MSKSLQFFVAATTKKTGTLFTVTNIPLDSSPFDHLMAGVKNVVQVLFSI